MRLHGVAAIYSLALGSSMLARASQWIPAGSQAMKRNTTTMPLVGDVMTLVPRTVLVHQPVATAIRLMKEYGVRHLPVTDDRGKLVGVLSERDVHEPNGKASSALLRSSVEELMTPKPYAVAPNAFVTQVARAMASKKLGSAVVVDKGEILGVFTRTDALKALADALEGKLTRIQTEVDAARLPSRPRTRRIGREALA